MICNACRAVLSLCGAARHEKLTPPADEHETAPRKTVPGYSEDTPSHGAGQSESRKRFATALIDRKSVLHDGDHVGVV